MKRPLSGLEHRACTATFCLVLIVGICLHAEAAPRILDNVVKLGTGVDSFKVAVISDLHIGASETFLSNLHASVETIIGRKAAGENILLTMVTGDIVSAGDTAEDGEFDRAILALNALDTAGIPWAPLIGNHDMVPRWSTDNGATWHEADTVRDMAGESLFVSRGFAEKFEARYRYLDSLADDSAHQGVLRNFEKYAELQYNFEAEGWGGLHGRDFVQNFAFEVGPSGGGFRFLCLDFNSRSHGSTELLGVLPAASINRLDFNNLASSVSIFQKGGLRVFVWVISARLHDFGPLRVVAESSSAPSAASTLRREARTLAAG